MNRTFLPALLILTVTACSCSTPTTLQTAYHLTDATALVIESLDANTCRILQPAPSGNIANEQILITARSLPQHQTAVVILQNYSEPQIGDQFRDRSTLWFTGLRGLGYDHIIFLQGTGNNSPEGLVQLASYN